jgi:PKD repeat protein
VPKQCSWQPGQGDPADELKNLSPDNLPDMSVVVGAARSATTFIYSAVINALGKYAALELFYFDYGDGTGYGSSASLRSLTSFPTTHIYVQPGTYKIVGYGRFEGKTESASMTIVVPPASAPDPTPDKVDSTDWAPAKTPAANAVIPVTSTSSSSSADLSIGTGGKTISEATSAAPSTSEKKAPGVDAKANQVVIVSVPSLPAGADVSGKVKVGKTWRTLPTVEVDQAGVLTLPALTFAKAGTYSVRLSVESGGTKFVTVKVKK